MLAPLRVNGDGPDDDAVAAYVANYVTKEASETGAGIDHPLTTWADIKSAPVSEHVRTLMRACWRLGGLPECAPLRLRAWAHTLATAVTSSPSPGPTRRRTRHSAPSGPAM